jgi:hypothetical protein
VGTASGGFYQRISVVDRLSECKLSQQDLAAQKDGSDALPAHHRRPHGWEAPNWPQHKKEWWVMKDSNLRPGD